MKRDPEVPLPRIEGSAEVRANAVEIELATCAPEPLRCQTKMTCKERNDAASNLAPCQERGGRHA